MDPLLAAALVSAGVKGTTALAQRAKANKLSKVERPTYTTPGQISRYVAGARTRATDTKLPGQNYIEQKLGKATSDYMYSVKEAGNPNDIMQAAASAYSNQQNSLLDLNIAASNDYARRQRAKDEALLMEAQYKDKEFMYNQNDPYMASKAAESALRESSTRNFVNAASDLMSVGTTYAQGKAAGVIGGPKSTPAVPSESGTTDAQALKGTSVTTPVDVTTDIKSEETTSDLIKFGPNDVSKLPQSLKNMILSGDLTKEQALEIYNQQQGWTR